ncbi:phosphotransferase [Oceanobacillus manasiensis]|uniref:phosphotransferase n=1 Tax=Oceanobacillus manasiensis TaxID=586413 RepID=UPI0005A990E2|nr:phosphotransferase [Oceanobacillus manasiensis]
MEIEKILKLYSVYPLTVENITTHLWKIYDGNRSYALKESKLSSGAIANWERALKLADYHQLSSFLPVYMTRNGQLYQEHLGKYYYLMPWIEQDSNRGDSRNLADFYSSIGLVHAKTKQSKQIDKDTFIREFGTYEQACETLFNELNRTVARFEQSHYMSPLELMVCTQFRDMELVFQNLTKRLKQLVYVSDDEQLTWNTSMCHGQLNRDHLLYHHHTQFINWEQARYENATMDLVHFFRAETLDYDAPTSAYTEQFDSYIKENKLSEKELQLLTIHLLHPFSYCRLIQEYVENASSQSMIVTTRQLQRAYRQLTFGLEWSDYVEKQYETITFDDLEG